MIPESQAFYHGMIQALLIDPRPPVAIFRVETGVGAGGMPLGGLFKSVDSGATWTEIDAGLPNGLVRSVAIDSATAGRLYAGTTIAGLFRSSDSGATWSLVSDALVGVRVEKVVLDPFIGGTVYAASNGSGVFRSTDAGQTFTPLNAGLTSLHVLDLAIDPSKPGRFYAASSGGGVFRSDDGGATWTPFNTGLTNMMVGSLALGGSGAFVHAATNGSGVFDFQVSADSGLLSLSAAHSFSVRLFARDQRTGRAGTGLAIPQSDLFGYFSIPELTFNPGNPEVFVKILDGTGINGKYWVFFGGLTDLEYTLAVTEDATGKTKTYRKAAGSACGGFDTEAFP